MELLLEFFDTLLESVPKFVEARLDFINLHLQVEFFAMCFGRYELDRTFHVDHSIVEISKQGGNIGSQMCFGTCDGCFDVILTLQERCVDYCKFLHGFCLCITCDGCIQWG